MLIERHRQWIKFGQSGDQDSTLKIILLTRFQICYLLDVFEVDEATVTF